MTLRIFYLTSSGDCPSVSAILRAFLYPPVMARMMPVRSCLIKYLSAEFVPKYNAEEKAIVYGVTGGVAKYLTLFDDKLSLDDNLIKNYFTTSGYLYEEPMNLLSQEFRTVNTYNTVIEVCAGGANKVTEIADKAHITTATLAYVLKSLDTVGIISKITPMTEKENNRRSVYEVTDSMYRFWYSFIPGAKAAIEMNRGEVFYKNYVKDKIHSFMGKVFEDMCRYYTLSQGLDGRQMQEAGGARDMIIYLRTLMW